MHITAPDATVGCDSAIEQFETVLPKQFGRWHWFNRAQYVESRSLMAGYLLCSQGDRMLMANSVEGRFPFLDHRVIEFARRVPPKLLMRGLDEKHLLKRAMGPELPPEIVERPKQPYRAPDALSLAGAEAQEWIAEVASRGALTDAGCFEPSAAQQLLAKCAARAASGQFSNSDNMGVVGVLSTQLVHHHFIRHRPTAFAPPHVRTCIDRLGVAGRSALGA